jgi:hypothetical protein
MSDTKTGEGKEGVVFRRFAFLALAVMTQSYIRYRHDATFPQEQSTLRTEQTLMNI